MWLVLKEPVHTPAFFHDQSQICVVSPHRKPSDFASKRIPGGQVSAFLSPVFQQLFSMLGLRMPVVYRMSAFPLFHMFAPDRTNSALSFFCSIVARPRPKVVNFFRDIKDFKKICDLLPHKHAPCRVPAPDVKTPKTVRHHKAVPR